MKARLIKTTDSATNEPIDAHVCDPSASAVRRPAAQIDRFTIPLDPTLDLNEKKLLGAIQPLAHVTLGQCERDSHQRLIS